MFGLAYDPESGVASVNVLLDRITDSGRLYWDGAIRTATPMNLPATYTANDISWHLNAALPSGDNLPNASYSLDVSAANNEAPSGSGLLSLNFSVDYHPVYVFTAGSYNDIYHPNNWNMRWDNPENWDVGTVPTTNAWVIINGYSPDNTSLGSFQLYRLDLSGGTLTTSGMLLQKLNLSSGNFYGGTITLATDGVCNWSGGTIGGIFNVSSGAVFNVSNTAPKVLADSAVLINGGTINWQGGDRSGEWLPRRVFHHQPAWRCL